MTDKREGLFTRFQQQQAWLSTEFGQKLAMTKLNLTERELEGLVGRYKSGKRVGQLRGQIVWFNNPHGGWVREIGGVVPQCNFGYTICDYNGTPLHPSRPFVDGDDTSEEKYVAALYREHCCNIQCNIQKEKISKYLEKNGVQLENPLVQIIGDFRDFEFSTESIESLQEKDRELTRNKNKNSFRKLHSDLCAELETEIGFFLNALQFVPVWNKLTESNKKHFSPLLEAVMVKYELYDSAFRLDVQTISELKTEIIELKAEMLAAAKK